MGPSLRLIPLFAIAVLMLAGLSACANSGSSSSTIAHVGARTISKGTLDHWTALEGLTASGATVERRTHLRGALGLLISADQLLDEAAAMHITVSAKEAEARLAELEWDRARGFRFEPASQSRGFAKLLRPTGETREDQLFLLTLDLTAAKVEQSLLRQAESRLTRVQIAAYYAAHKTRYVLPERRDLEVIGSYQRPIIMQAKREVQEGRDFLAVARRVSIDQEAPKGLELHLARGEEEPEYDKVAFQAKPGVLYGPYLQAFFFIFKVIKVTPSRQIPLASSEVAIRRVIATSKRREILAAFGRDIEEHWMPHTDCRATYVVPGCRQYPGAASASVTP